MKEGTDNSKAKVLRLSSSIALKFEIRIGAGPAEEFQLADGHKQWVRELPAETELWIRFQTPEGKWKDWEHVVICESNQWGVIDREEKEGEWVWVWWMQTPDKAAA